jgi:hypothetical protein
LSAGGLIVGLASVSVVVLPASAASANTDVVTTCSGSASVPGSLPNEVGAAGSGDTITFQSGLVCPPSSPITLTTTLSISRPLTITGPGPRTMAVSGGVGVVSIAAAISGLTIENAQDKGINNNHGTVTLTDTTLTGNSSHVDGGGAIYNSGTVTLIDSTLSNNNGYTSGGGGIFNSGGTVTITDSTLSGNTAHGPGGGIYNNGTVTLTDSTLSGNSSDEGGSGIFNGDMLTVGATILTGNTGGDCWNYNGAIPTDEGYNLDSDGSCGFSTASPFFDLPSTNPTLGPLQNNGGPTDTMALLPGSPAIDYVSIASGLCPATDQRGAARTAPCDVGAYDTDGNPTIKKVKPAKGKVGKKVTITGTNLSGATTVSFNGTPAVVKTDKPTKITTNVPAGATTGPISVTTSTGGTVTTTKSFKVT